jgi:hypothetical protein
VEAGSVAGPRLAEVAMFAAPRHLSCQAAVETAARRLAKGLAVAAVATCLAGNATAAGPAAMSASCSSDSGKSEVAARGCFSNGAAAQGFAAKSAFVASRTSWAVNAPHYANRSQLTTAKAEGSQGKASQPRGIVASLVSANAKAL